MLRLRDTFARFEAVFVARDTLFVVLRLREAFARFEAVFVARDAVFAAVRPRALPPPTLARDWSEMLGHGGLAPCWRSLLGPRSTACLNLTKP